MIFDSGRHKYELVDNWAKLPEGMAFDSAATSIAIDSQDRVFIFLRHPTHPVLVLTLRVTC